MPSPNYRLARIASYSGVTPTIDPALTFEFDDLRDEEQGFAVPERKVELITRPGVPGHGVRIGEVTGPAKRLRGRRAFQTLSDAQAFGINLKQLKPRLGQATDHGTLLTLIGQSDWAYDVVSVRVLPPTLFASGGTRLVAPLGASTPIEQALCEGFYEIAVKRRVDGPGDTSIL